MREGFRTNVKNNQVGLKMTIYILKRKGFRTNVKKQSSGIENESLHKEENMAV
jgi:hypothetical protein